MRPNFHFNQLKFRGLQSNVNTINVQQTGTAVQQQYIGDGLTTQDGNYHVEGREVEKPPVRCPTNTPPRRVEGEEWTHI